MKLAQSALLLLLASTSLAAQDLQIVGTITRNVQLPKSSLTQDSTSLKRTTNTKEIKLLDIKLSAKALSHLASRGQKGKQASLAVNRSKYPARVELGMNEVPVLDQGSHGTCVTFANTAAIDAALNKGDHLSQLCQLQLGSYLERTSYAPSGWNGSWGRTVLHQMDSFGVVTKEQQLAKGCAGIVDYPANDHIPDQAMSPEEYFQVSSNLEDMQISWSPILDVNDAMTDRIDTSKAVEQVKASLAAGDRLTFGVLLLDFDLGFVGAVGTTKAENDTWVLTPQILRDLYLKPNLGGHEMVITGYDDDAKAIDDNGAEHRGLFTLRNSWGTDVGDEGNFYMSYDYFKVLVVEIQRIRGLDRSGC